MLPSTSPLLTDEFNVGGSRSPLLHTGKSNVGTCVCMGETQ